MKEIIYRIINFLILIALIIIFGRKKISEIFESRREKIIKALDEAEKTEKTEMPTFDPESVSPENVSISSKSDESEFVQKLSGIEKSEKETCLEMRREMLSEIRLEAINKIKAKAVDMFSRQPYRSMLSSRESEMAVNMLKSIHLTPGDIAYLKTHDVLYVTLTSAYPMPDNVVKQIGDYTEKMLAEIGGKTSYWVKQDPSLIDGFCLRIGDTIYDCSIKEELYRLTEITQKEFLSGDESVDDILNTISKDIVNMGSRVHTYQLGRVLTVSDGICWMDGLADIMYGEVVEFECGEFGMVLDIKSNKIGCVIYGKYEHIESGSRVRRVGRIASVPVGDQLLGRVVNALGQSIDGRGIIRTTERRPIECHAPTIPERAPVDTPLHTGIKAIDALVPIGRGQRELIIGDRQTGKTSIAVDAILNQKGKDVICIYVAIGQKETTVAEVREKLEKYGAMDYTTIVCATASDSASLQYIAPFSGTAMGEYFMYSGRDVLIIYDDLSKHAVAYRELSLLLHRPSGREAYPGDIFYLHSRLLERSAKLSKELGGGSMTALPVIETLAGDISSYIPTNVISITDGQIFLDTELFYEGQRPAVNVGLSVSRVGSAAQTKIMKQFSASLRMKLAQYRELAGFSQFGADVDEATKKTLDAGKRMMDALKQGRNRPLSDWKQVLLIFAVSEGFADNVNTEEIEEFENNLFSYFENVRTDIKNRLETGKKLSEEEIDGLREALNGLREVV